MSSDDLKKLIDERESLLAELSSLSRILHGSWVERYSTCSRPDCICRHGERHGPRRYLVVNIDGRQRQKYIPNNKVGNALKGIEQYRRLREIIDRITMINLTLMRKGGGDDY
jgi:hypothetical protein